MWYPSPHGHLGRNATIAATTAATSGRIHQAERCCGSHQRDSLLLLLLMGGLLPLQLQHLLLVSGHKLARGQGGNGGGLRYA